MLTASRNYYETIRNAARERLSSERLARPNTATKLSRSPLSHPLFLALLFLLALNDHVLKGSGLLPEILTGKLSDFAGLLVAPLVLVALVALVGARGTTARAACFLLVGAVFAAIKVSPELALAFERATALIGVPWSVMADPTDLIGFAIYPLAWRIGREGVPIRGAVDRASLVAASIACAASSPASAWSTSAYLVNRTEAQISVRLRWARSDLDCDAIAGRAAEVFGPDAFGPVSTFNLEPKHTLALEARNADPSQTELAVKRCEAVMVKVRSLPDTIVFFTDATRTVVPEVVDEEDEDDLEFDIGGMLVLEESKRRALSLRAHDGVETSAVIDALPALACGEPPSERFAWSSFPESLREELVGLAVGADGCLALDFALLERRYLCTPADEFPFAEGDVLTVTSTDGASGRSLTMVREDQNETVTFNLWSGDLERAPLAAAAVDRDGCGHRLAQCGGFAVPVTLELGGGDQLVSGTALDTIDAEEHSVRYVLGTAEHVLAGNDACEPGRDVAGRSADILWVKREVK